MIDGFTILSPRSRTTLNLLNSGGPRRGEALFKRAGITMPAPHSFNRGYPKCSGCEMDMQKCGEGRNRQAVGKTITWYVWGIPEIWLISLDCLHLGWKIGSRKITERIPIRVGMANYRMPPVRMKKAVFVIEDSYKRLHSTTTSIPA